MLSHSHKKRPAGQAIFSTSYREKTGMGWSRSGFSLHSGYHIFGYQDREETMAIKGEWVHYGDQIGYLAKAERASAPLPGIVVIQEAWGVNEQIEDVTRRIAAAGYVALAPDLYAVKVERPSGSRPGADCRSRGLHAAVATGHDDESRGEGCRVGQATRNRQAADQRELWTNLCLCLPGSFEKHSGSSPQGGALLAIRTLRDPTTEGRMCGLLYGWRSLRSSGLRRA